MRKSTKEILDGKESSNSLTDLTRRPSALFLIGDQIYADDVADVLIKHLTHSGMKLVGYEESINGSDRKLADIPIGTGNG
jgi:hypothetical protein